ncbi:MAG: hypothetical protein MZV63_06840 [Marinilabiliales bacterium]|nr:hypothetical protein [Marinilabiliales bacterium]
MYRILAWGAFTHWDSSPMSRDPSSGLRRTAFEALKVGMMGRLVHRRADPVHRAHHPARDHLPLRHPPLGG